VKENNFVFKVLTVIHSKIIYYQCEAATYTLYSAMIALKLNCQDLGRFYNICIINTVSLQDCAEEAGTSITGGQTVLNPWCLIGGVATAVCQPNELIM